MLASVIFDALGVPIILVGLGIFGVAVAIRAIWSMTRR